ncbi:MAG TPA: S53 family peptidase, partial [Candidatus Dormibacteraeota bacterium]|nr:S53 family peptidase [Candidatus Dormibacteraeota bacterium]
MPILRNAACRTHGAHRFRPIARRLYPVLLAAACILILPRMAGAQTVTVRPRIAGQVDESQLTVLRGNMHPLARAQYDQGRVSPSFPLERITMMFQMTAAQQADLAALLAAQQNPTSPSFHQWLTPAQYGDRFGLAQADLNKVTAWLQAQGLEIVETPASRNMIVFNGTAAQVESAFHIQFHNYNANGRKFYANSAEPSIPSALSGVVAGFRGLNNYRLKPRAIRKSPLSGIPQPHFTSGISGNTYVTPGDFAVIYDLNPLYSAGTAIDGTGQNIVVAGQSNIVLADIAAFRTAAGLPPKTPTVILTTATDPGVLDSTGDEQESSLDVEWAGAVAKNAMIIFVYSNNGAFDAVQYAITNNLAPVISVSYGTCEALLSSSDLASLTVMAQQANAQGITLVSSVGDGGATDCDGTLGNYPATLGLNVDVPGSLPYVTGVGGTEFDEGNGSYWKTTTVPGPDIITSAKSYIPEMAWNDTSVQNGLFAGGGGASSLFGKPSWQTGTGVPNDGARDVPDISLNASPVHDPYLICDQFQPSGSNTYTSSCLNGTFRYSDNSLQAYGGTSFGAPTFAGIVALINQKTGSNGQGNLNYILYPLAASSSTAFHDVTTGDNKSPCTSGTQDCPDGSAIGFTAGLGYDQVTGLGSIDATNLVNAWSSISTSAGSTPILSSISPTSKTAGSANFILTATGSNFATKAQILWNGSTAGVTMIPGGTATSISATISSSLVTYGTIASVSVTDDAPTAGQSTVKTFTVNGVPPANDNIANAIVVTSSNFTSTVDNSAATTELTDPTPACVSGSTNTRTKTVWWSLMQSISGNVTISTIGSVYDTTLSVWSGTPGSLTAVACNDDISSGQ